ncbi:hypothetical protein AN189_13020 [Loktanella sp. 3ANDIMAR09]|uniref:Gp49 family protein n=1 Tax=Loktanella sp. 3ANDIMAR09 TaxID=1225657 RepID=UPI0006FF45C2|nr:Gp49 family protein [Loktanella sp. 3ANDIMAR09]KQI68024.1 hypothetical protein AN189_13020 [Loktanella sp. 3ANDIMAR09]
MSKSETEIEAAIVERGLNAARLTPDLIDSAIAGVDYHVFPGTQKTVCCLSLKNGFSVIGEAACASPENFDAEIGRRIAYSDAREKIWGLEGYLLKQRLFEAGGQGQ